MMMARPRKPVPDEKDRKIMEAIEAYIQENGIPPSIREIKERAKLSSTSVVKSHLQRLAEAGYIEYQPEQARSIRILKPLSGVDPYGRVALLPHYGTIAAGEPLPRPTASEPLGTEPVPLDFLPTRNTEGLYTLEVRGESMIDALVNDGDLVVLQHTQTANPGEMVAAWLPQREETTLKFYYPKFDANGRVVEVQLVPAHPHMEPIVVAPDEVEIQGRVVLVLRRLDRQGHKPRSGKQAGRRPLAH